MPVLSPPPQPFILEYVGVTVTPTIAAQGEGPATWIQVIGAGTVVAVCEAGNSVPLVCGGGEVFNGSFTSITSSTATRVRVGNGAPPVSSPQGVNAIAVNLAGGSSSVTGVLPNLNIHEGQAAGAALTDAPATITVAQGYWRTMPAATLSVTRAIALSTSGAVAGDVITITRIDVGAYTMTVVNGGAGAGTLQTFPVSKVGFGDYQFDGTNWALKRCSPN